MTINITDQNFNEQIKSSDKLILVDFWAPWCGPCKTIAPALEDASNDLAEKIIVYKLNIDDNPQAPSKYGVRGVPTILFFKAGQVIDKQVGAIPKAKLYDKIQDVYIKNFY